MCLLTVLSFASSVTSLQIGLSLIKRYFEVLKYRPSVYLLKSEGLVDEPNYLREITVKVFSPLY